MAPGVSSGRTFTRPAGLMGCVQNALHSRSES